MFWYLWRHWREFTSLLILSVFADDFPFRKRSVNRLSEVVGNSCVDMTSSLSGEQKHGDVTFSDLYAKHVSALHAFCSTPVSCYPAVCTSTHTAFLLSCSRFCVRFFFQKFWSFLFLCPPRGQNLHLIDVIDVIPDPIPDPCLLHGQSSQFTVALAQRY